MKQRRVCNEEVSITCKCDKTIMRKKISVICHWFKSLRIIPVTLGSGRKEISCENGLYVANSVTAQARKRKRFVEVVGEIKPRSFRCGLCQSWVELQFFCRKLFNCFSATIFFLFFLHVINQIQNRKMK